METQLVSSTRIGDNSTPTRLSLTQRKALRERDRHFHKLGSSRRGQDFQAGMHPGFSAAALYPRRRQYLSSAAHPTIHGLRLLAPMQDILRPRSSPPPT